MLRILIISLIFLPVQCINNSCNAECGYTCKCYSPPCVKHTTVVPNCIKKSPLLFYPDIGEYQICNTALTTWGGQAYIKNKLTVYLTNPCGTLKAKNTINITELVPIVVRRNVDISGYGMIVTAPCPVFSVRFAQGAYELNIHDITFKCSSNNAPIEIEDTGESVHIYAHDIETNTDTAIKTNGRHQNVYIELDNISAKEYIFRGNITSGIVKASCFSQEKIVVNDVQHTKILTPDAHKCTIISYVGTFDFAELTQLINVHDSKDNMAVIGPWIAALFGLFVYIVSMYVTVGTNAQNVAKNNGEK